MSQQDDPTTDARDALTRRGVLQGTAAAAGTAALATPAYAEHLTEPRPAVQNEVGGRTFTLLGIVSGWIGVGPDEIDGATGPPLRMLEGEEHTVVWINGDGSHHNFAIEDDEGEIIEFTEILEEAGEFQEITVTAEEGLAEYYCDPHPVQMRGPIEVIDPADVHELRVHVEDGDGNPLEAEVYLGDDRHSFSDLAARPDPDEEEVELAQARFDMLEDGEYELEAWTYQHERVQETVTIDGGDEELTIAVPEIEVGDPVETYELTLEHGQWVGEAPDAVAGEENPTLEFEAGETYAVEWHNEVGRDHEYVDEDAGVQGEPLPGHNFAIATDGETDLWNTHVRSDFTDEPGESQTVEFVATEEMAVYLDQSQLDASGEVIVE